MMGPGHYVVDITLTGFKPVHKIISVEKGGKVVLTRRWSGSSKAGQGVNSQLLALSSWPLPSLHLQLPA